MAPQTPYSKYLADRDPMAAIADTAYRIRALTTGWAAEDYERTYAPGKWTGRQILIHLLHGELALGNRARMALTTPGYAAQAFDQDKWMEKEAHTPGPDALNAFLALSTMNLELFRSLSPSDRAITMSHPEYGEISVDWVIHTIAGHQINHLLQLETIAGAR